MNISGVSPAPIPENRENRGKPGNSLRVSGNSYAYLAATTGHWAPGPCNNAAGLVIAPSFNANN